MTASRGLVLHGQEYGYNRDERVLAPHKTPIGMMTPNILHRSQSMNDRQN